MSAHVLALDISLTSTGAAAIHQTGHVATWVKTTESLPCHLGHRPCKEHQPSPIAVDRRITEIHTWFKGLLTAGTVLVVLEGPSLHSTFGKPHERAQLYGRIVHTLVVNNIPFGIVAPKRMKWFVTGSGTADKALVRSTVARLYPGWGLAGVTEDETDAMGLAAMGQCWLGWKGPWFDARALAIETGAQWPERESVTA